MALKVRLEKCLLRQLRESKGWTQEYLGKLCGKSASQISDYETNSRPMGFRTAIVIAHVLDCSLEDLYVWTVESSEKA